MPRRWRPVSDLWNSSTTRSMSGSLSAVLVGELGVPDPDAVAAVQRLGPLQELLVEERAVRRAEVLEHHDRALPDQPRVARGGERVLEADLGAVAAAEDRARADVVDEPRPVAGRALDDQLGLQVAVPRGAVQARPP